MGKRGINFSCTDKQLAVLLAVARAQQALGGGYVTTANVLKALAYQPTIRNLRCSMSYLEDYGQLESRRVSNSPAAALEWKLTPSGAITLNDNRNRIAAGLRL